MGSGVAGGGCFGVGEIGAVGQTGLQQPVGGFFAAFEGVVALFGEPTVGKTDPGWRLKLWSLFLIGKEGIRWK